MGSAYLMIKDDLRGLIENGGYAVGELIPSQSDLAETYGVSAPTVKRAVELLAREGFLEAVAGGYVVARRRVPQGYATTLRSYYEERGANTSFPETKIIRFCTVGASDLEARRLGIAPGAPVYRTVRLRYADGKPFVFLTNCTPCEYFHLRRDGSPGPGSRPHHRDPAGHHQPLRPVGRTARGATLQGDHHGLRRAGSRLGPL